MRGRGALRTPCGRAASPPVPVGPVPGTVADSRRPRGGAEPGGAAGRTGSARVTPGDAVPPRRGRGLSSRSCSPPMPPESTATSRSTDWSWGSARPPRRGPAGRTVNVKAASLNHHDLWSLRGRRPRRGQAADDPRLRRRRDRRGRQRGRPALRHRPDRPRRRPEGAPLHPHRALPGHLRRAGRRTDVERPAEAQGALLRGGRLSADRLADRVPHALHQRRGTARRLRPRPGRGRRRRHRRDRARQGGRAAGLRHQPRRGQAQAGRRTRCRRGVRVRAPGCRSGWTPSSRRSARPPGRTR